MTDYGTKRAPAADGGLQLLLLERFGLTARAGVRSTRRLLARVNAVRLGWDR